MIENTGEEVPVEVMYTLCAYCERNAAEIAREDDLDDPEDALDFVLIGDKRVLLCERCRTLHAPNAVSDLQKLLEGPIDFPPGITAVEHTCPELMHQGKDDEEATFELLMRREEGFFVATCPHCKVTVRSSAGENFFGNEKDGRNPLPGEDLTA